MWVYKEEGDPMPQLQSVTFALSGDLAAATTLADLVTAQIQGKRRLIAKYVGAQQESIG